MKLVYASKKFMYPTKYYTTIRFSGILLLATTLTFSNDFRQQNAETPHIRLDSESAHEGGFRCCPFYGEFVRLKQKQWRNNNTTHVSSYTVCYSCQNITHATFYNANSSPSRRCFRQTAIQFMERVKSTLLNLQLFWEATKWTQIMDDQLSVVGDVTLPAPSRQHNRGTNSDSTLTAFMRKMNPRLSHLVRFLSLRVRNIRVDNPLIKLNELKRSVLLPHG